MARSEFAFEQFLRTADAHRSESADSNRRKYSEAIEEMRVLLRRLTNGAAEDIKPGPRRDVLVAYSLDCLLNIGWYERALRRTLRTQRLWATGVVALGLVAIGGLVATALTDSKLQNAQLGLLVVGVFAALQMLASLVDTKARVGAFWKASSALKASLFGLEEHWRERPVVVDDELTDDFFSALQHELAGVRKALVEERNDFFETYRTASEILTVATSALDAVRGGSREYLSGKGRPPKAERPGTKGTAERITAAMQTLLAEEAAVAGAQFLVDAFKDQPDKLAHYHEELLKAQAKRKVAEHLLDSLQQ